jgi:hypothetical protein
MGEALGLGVNSHNMIWSMKKESHSSLRLIYTLRRVKRSVSERGKATKGKGKAASA